MESNKKLWAGRIISALPILFLLFDSIIHMMNPKFVTDSFIMLGYSPDVAFPLGVLLLICLIIYVIPRTSILGAILLTGYLGGAVATNFRIGSPLLGYVLFPVYVGVFLWGGLYLRNERVRELIPLQRS